MGKAFFVTGTGTDVGKTYFSSLFMAKYAEKYSFQYWKPIQTGILESSDTQFIQKITKLPIENFRSPLYELKAPASPHYAAKLENQEIDPKFVLGEISKVRKQNVLIEGAGGIFVPWTDQYMTLRGIQESNLDVVLVVSSELGTINHSLMSLDILLNRFVPVAGFYMVGPKNSLVEDNISTIQKFGGVSCLGCTFFPNQKLNPEEFRNFAHSEFDSDRFVIDSILPVDDED